MFRTESSTGVVVDSSQLGTAPRKLRILLVNDRTRESVVAQELTRNGYQVFWAKDGREARWLWLPDFYYLVLIRLPSTSWSLTRFVEGISHRSPQQRVLFWDQTDGTVELMSGISGGVSTQSCDVAGLSTSSHMAR